VDRLSHKDWWRKGVLTWPQYMGTKFTAKYHFFWVVLTRYVRRRKYVTPKELDKFWQLWVATHGDLTHKGFEELFRLMCQGGAINMPSKWVQDDEGMLSLYDVLSWKAKYNFDYVDARRYTNRVASAFDSAKTERDRLSAMNTLIWAIQKCARIKPMKKEIVGETANHNG
jgi:hypothetical protein